MIQIQLINSVTGWERLLEIVEQRRKNHRYEPYVNYLAFPLRSPKERTATISRVFQHHNERQSSDAMAESLTGLPSDRFVDIYIPQN